MAASTKADTDSLDSLSALATYVQAAETRSFTQAARVLGLTASAVGKTVARLEASLGVRLFHRSTRSISLTPDGEVFLESCRRVLSEIDSVERELAGNHASPRGKLRVSLPYLSGLFGKVLAGFMAMYPDIELDLDYSDRLVDIVNEGFDVAIRTGEGVDSRLISRRLGVYHLVLVASPAYLERAGAPKMPGDLAGHACIHHRFPSTGKLERWPFRQSDKGLDVVVPVAVSASTIAPMLELAIEGGGIACVPDFSVTAAIEAGLLKPVLSGQLEYQNVFRAVWPSHRHISPRLRVFLDYMSAHLFADERK
jgi:DNA-binding transcriptional LysR family regulator